MLRADNVKDDKGYRAVFTEQGASAAQMAAAKFLDNVSMLLGWKAKRTTQSLRGLKCACRELPDC